MANKIEISSKNIKPRISLNHNIYIIRRVIQQQNIFIQDDHLLKHIAQAYNEHP